MGLSLSLLSSAWEEILNHSFLILPYELNLGLKVDDTFDNISKSETISKEPDRDSCDDDQSRRNSISSKRSHEPLKIMLETTLSFKNLVQDFKKPEPDHLNLRTDRLPASPGPTIFFSPRPVSELNAAATTVQKIYKSYRTRRNLADCAIVVEGFRFCSFGSEFSFIDPRHRYGHNLHIYYDIWFKSESSQPFFYWLDVGDGKEINLEKCPRIRLQRQCIKYLGPVSFFFASLINNERESYEVIVENGKLVYRQSGLLLETIEGSKWIFVLSTTKNLYAIWPYSGHYLPTEENFRDFISFLEENHVDLTDVKRCSVDDDDVGFSFKVTQTETKPKPLVIPRPRPQDILRAPTHAERTITLTDAPISPSLQEADRMSCKWTSGTGPRIGCVRDYPSELQFMALEKVHLSPRIIPGNFGPIPSPRPSPKVRLSPRISYMGIPSPRTPIATN
ncbi:hypothetical protein Ccrd_003966, partial [Cynara cardunculus var. scolymus]